MKRAVLASVLLAACAGDGTLDFKPVIEGPITEDSDALAFPVIDEFDLSVANEGDSGDIVSNRFKPGDDVSLVGIPFGDHLVMHASGARVDLPVAYGRTCGFSLAAGAPPPAPHLFFSRTAKFATFDAGDGNDGIASPIPRLDGTALNYLGSALLIGGTNPESNVPEMYEPSTGVLTRMAPVRPRIGAIAALVGSPAQPKILLIGGTELGSPTTFYELIDPTAVDATNQVTRTPDVHFSRNGLTATTLSDGRVVVVGGASATQPVSSDIYQVTLEDVDVRIEQEASLVHARTGHTATPLGSSIGAPVLIAGGTDGVSATPVDVAELYKPLQGTLADPATFAPVMKHPRTRHQAVRMADDSVLFIGGVDASGTPVRALERFTLEEGFTDLADEQGHPVSLEPSFGVIGINVTKLPDDRVLLTGGQADTNGPSVLTALLLRLDPLTGTIDLVPTDSLQFARTNHQATVMCDGTVLISGGNPAGIKLERYNPPATGRR
ncbi:MAG TPA: hypothetical protein VGM90_40970 [Kofleriaceae bacterium]